MDWVVMTWIDDCEDGVLGRKMGWMGWMGWMDGWMDVIYAADWTIMSWNWPQRCVIAIDASVSLERVMVEEDRSSS